MRPSERYRRDAQAVRAFRDAYDRFIGASHSSDEARQQVGLLAGPAGEATDRARLSVLQAGMQFNPIRNWSGSLSSRTIHSFCDSAFGSLMTRADEAAERERGLVGLLARFLRFPVDVREAAGFESEAGRTFALWAAVAAQVLAIVIGAGVLALIGLAIK